MLDDVQVLDLSHLLPGQYATALLAQLGADVVSIERPGGHKSRDYPTSFTMYNHSKRSIVIDLKEEEGRDAFLDLAATADVVVEQFRPGIVERLGIDYDAISAVNPQMVYCSISGYGQQGPRAGEIGHDVNYISLAGVLDQTGDADGPPILPGVPIADLGSSVFAALSIAAALLTDNGEYIDLSMTDVAVNMASDNLAEMFGRGTAPKRGETLTGGAYPCYSVYPCADGECVSIAAVEPHFWETLCEEIGCPSLVDKQWATGDERDAVFEELTKLFQTQTAEEWLNDLDPSEVPISTVHSLEEVPDDPHVRHRELLSDVEYDSSGKETKAVTYPATFDEYAPTIGSAPEYGEHTYELLAEAGYDEAVIEALKEQDVVDEG